MNTLEYPKIISMLAEYATCDLGKKACLSLKPAEHSETINRMQDETSAALSRIFRKGNPSFGNAKDLFVSLKRLAVGSPLSQHELLLTAGILENAGR
ncbi:MAG: endonuclease MutS2, partial [Eubacterium sp.]|nr:endonuclease MutS2 [Eubacterium sp.]